MTPEKRQNAIVLLIDGLNPTFLSSYGCTWIATPAFDQLASQSVTFETAVTESIDPVSVCRSFFSGQHPGLQATESDESLEIPELAGLVEAGFSTILLTDNPDQFANSDNFESVVHVEGLAHLIAQPAAADVSETFLAKSISRVLSELPRQTTPFLAVIHLTSLTSVWDAPLHLREKFRDEDDPEAMTSTIPPARKGDFDPDEVLSVTHAYAAQLEALDTCLDVLMQELQLDGLLDNTLMMVAGLRGFPVGHQNCMGHVDSHLGSDATRVALFIRPPEQSGLSAIRSHELTCVSEWFAYVTGWLADKPTSRLHSIVAGTNSEFDPLHFAVVCAEGSRAIWTPAWLLVERDDRPQLFVKPDDRWDINPVQDRCRGIAEDLQAVLEKACSQLKENQPVSVGPLADELVFGLE